MKQIKKYSIVVLCLFITLIYTLPISAKENVTKDESVYVILNENGSVKDITVSEWLHSDNGFNNYIDTSDLNDIKSLNSDDKIEVIDQKINFNTNKEDIYYEGKSNKALPFELDIKYYLDDKEVKASELLNQSGHLKMEIKINDKLNNNAILPLIMMTNLKCEEFKNIKVSSGDVISDGINQMVVMASVLGIDEIKNDLDIKELDDIINNYFIIEADAINMSVPCIMGASANSHEIDLNDFNIDTNSFRNDINKLKDATSEIVDGTTKLKDANKELSSKMNEFKTNIDKFKEGTDTLNTNTLKIKDGMNTLDNAINTLVNGINDLFKIFNSLNDEEKIELISLSKELIDGLNSAKTNLEMIKPMLNEANNQLSNIDIIIKETVNEEVIKSAYSEFSDIVTSNIANIINDKINNTNIDTSSFINNDSYMALVSKLIESGMDEESAKQMVASLINEEAINNLKVSLNASINEAINNDNTKEIIKAGATKVNIAIIDNLATKLKEMTSTQMNVMIKALDSAQIMINDMSGKIDNLNNIISKIDINSLENTIDIMLKNKDNLNSLLLGSKTLKEATIKLSDGTNKIASSTNDILNATNSFNEAMNTLKEKTQELNDGTIKFSKEGIDVLENKMNEILDKFSNIKASLDKLSDKDNMYTNYALVSDATTSKLKIIFKTNEIIKEKVSTQNVVQNEVKTSFFDRLLNLFK